MTTSKRKRNRLLKAIKQFDNMYERLLKTEQTVNDIIRMECKSQGIDKQEFVSRQSVDFASQAEVAETYEQALASMSECLSYMCSTHDMLDFDYGKLKADIEG